MTAAGIVGYLFGLLGKTKVSKSKIIYIFAALSAYLYGFITDIWTIWFIGNISVESILLVYASAFYFNTILAISTVIFLMLSKEQVFKKFKRIKNKYGINL